MTSFESALDAVNLGMAVLIWLVQIVIYPSFRHCDERGFRSWHESYTGRITFVVAPLMFAQLGLVAYITLQEGRLLDIAALTSCLVAWIATFAFSVPCHSALQARGRDLEIVERLIRTNWIRTAAWTAVLVLGLARSI